MATEPYSAPGGSENRPGNAAEDDTREARGHYKEQARETKEQARDKAHDLASRAREQAEHLADEAKEQAQTQLSGQKDYATNQLGSISAALRETSKNLHNEQQDTIAEYVGEAARKIDGLADYLHRHTVGELVTEAKQYARREPALFLGGAALLGLLGARFFKSSSPAGRYRDDVSSYGRSSYDRAYDEWDDDMRGYYDRDRDYNRERNYDRDRGYRSRDRAYADPLYTDPAYAERPYEPVRSGDRRYSTPIDPERASSHRDDSTDIYEPYRSEEEASSRKTAPNPAPTSEDRSEAETYTPSQRNTGPGTGTGRNV